ncbi:hypothetical protein FS749_007418 [Ceratobasidium sp. UAMH 11750]|nr:hypothetical protein FS749_007418 [Ceratobasidium sp. UAMH 11750]
MPFEPYVPNPAPTPTPAPPSGPTSYGAPSSYTYPNTSSDAMSSSAYPPSRRTKAGMVVNSPPTRDEIGPSTQGPESSAYSSDRHEDSAELTQVFGIGRSASGRLPPTYQER